MNVSWASIVGRAWADIVDEEEEQDEQEYGLQDEQTTWVDIVRRNLPTVREEIIEEQSASARNLLTPRQKYVDAVAPTYLEAFAPKAAALYEKEHDHTTWAEIVRRNLPTFVPGVEESEFDAHVLEEAIANAGSRAGSFENVPGDPVGIRAVQSILMSATQMSLSHFHTAGMTLTSKFEDNISIGRVVPSAADAMNSVYTKNNTSMTFESTKDVYALRKYIVGKSLMYFVETIGSNITGLPDRENIWYDVLEQQMYDGNILRIYIDYNKMRNHGLTLSDLACESFGTDCTKISPDFMGMIDVEINDIYLSQWLSKMSNKVCGTFDIASCNKINDKTAITVGSNLLAVSRIPNVDLRSITCNNVTEVEQHYGIEAAASVLQELTASYIVSDFMARTGKVLSFMKNSIEVHNKGLLTSMGFERPRDDIRKTIINHEPNSYSIYESIITGAEFANIFKIRKPTKKQTS